VNEEEECCPVCKIDLGCSAADKLRSVCFFSLWLKHLYFHLYLYIIIIILFIYFLFLPSYSLLLLIFEIFDLMFSDWVSFLAYPNLFGIKIFVVVVVVKTPLFQHTIIVPGDTYVYRSCCF
jgi:hypothetical protein